MNAPFQRRYYMRGICEETGDEHIFASDDRERAHAMADLMREDFEDLAPFPSMCAVGPVYSVTGIDDFGDIVGFDTRHLERAQDAVRELMRNLVYFRFIESGKEPSTG